MEERWIYFIKDNRLFVDWTLKIIVEMGRIKLYDVCVVCAPSTDRRCIERCFGGKYIPGPWRGRHGNVGWCRCILIRIDGRLRDIGNRAFHAHETSTRENQQRGVRCELAPGRAHPSIVRETGGCHARTTNVECFIIEI